MRTSTYSINEKINDSDPEPPGKIFAILVKFMQLQSFTRTWRQLCLDCFVAPDRSFRYALSFIDECETEWQQHRLTAEANRALEAEVLELYELGLAFPSLKWNKARFISNHTASRHRFLYYFDPDLEWLDNLDPNSTDYLQLPIEYELAVQRWEGLALSQGLTGCSLAKVTAEAGNTRYQKRIN